MINFPGADIEIPVYLHDGPYNILLIQVKNRADDLDTSSIKYEAQQSIERALESIKTMKSCFGIVTAMTPRRILEP